MTQAQFSAIAGQGKQSQVRYEAGDRSPDGDYLSAIANVGVDVLFVLTGRRSDALDSGNADEFGYFAARRLLDEASRFFDQEGSLPVTSASGRALELKQSLQRLSASPNAPDDCRAEADAMLSAFFQDADARARFSVKYKRSVLMARHALEELERIEAGTGWNPPKVVHHALLTLHMRNNLDPSELIDLLHAIRVSIEEKTELAR